MVSTNPPIGTNTLNRKRNTFCGVPKAEIERRTNALLQSMTVSLKITETVVINKKFIKSFTRKKYLYKYKI